MHASGETLESEFNFALKHRTYNPEIGRLVSIDPFQGNIHNPITLHKYIYGNDDPINKTDPSGRMSLAGGLGILGGIGLLTAMTLPAIRGAWREAFHIANNGTAESLMLATFKGQATWGDWARVVDGFGSGFGAGALNVADVMAFRQINSLHEYRNQLWQAQGLNESWIGTTSDGFAWFGTAALYSAAAVWTWSALGGGTMEIAVSKGSAPWYVHVQYGANGAWQQAVLGTGASGLGGMTITPVATGYVAGGVVTGIPVLFPSAVLLNTAEAGYALSCVTAAISAFGRGWGF